MTMSADWQSITRWQFSMAQNYFAIEHRRDNNNAVLRIFVNTFGDKLLVDFFTCSRTP